MTESRIPAAIDAIVASLRTAGLTVWDGPILSGDYSNAVYIGYDADPEGNPSAATVNQQEWAGVGTRKRDEEYLISCAAVVLIGDELTGWKTARDAVFALLEVVGQTLRADPSLGLPPPSVAELQPGEYYQEPGPEGYQARVLFSIHHKTRV